MTSDEQRRARERVTDVLYQALTYIREWGYIPAAVYCDLHIICQRHLIDAFKYDVTTVIDFVVETCLHKFLAPYFSPVGARLEPEHTLHEMYNMVLSVGKDHAFLLVETFSLDEAYHTANRNLEDDDEKLIAFGFDDALNRKMYMKALEEVRVEGGREEYAVVSQYIADVEKTQHATDYTTTAQSLGIDPVTVRKHVFRFVTRMAKSGS